MSAREDQSVILAQITLAAPFRALADVRSSPNDQVSIRCRQRIKPSSLENNNRAAKTKMTNVIAEPTDHQGQRV
jgi:hypothetical protein